MIFDEDHFFIDKLNSIKMDILKEPGLLASFLTPLLGIPDIACQ
jgi:hypothetical protein